MKITEKMLLENFDGLTKGQDMISVIKGENICWTYRSSNGDGTCCVCDPEYADLISLECSRTGIIDLDDFEGRDKLIAAVKTREAELWGAEIA